MDLLLKKREIVAEFGLEFDEAVNLFSEETLTSMGLSLIIGGEDYIGSNNNCKCNGNNCDCNYQEGNNCKCGGNNCNCPTKPAPAPTNPAPVV